MSIATYRVLIGDCLDSLRGLPDCSVQTCITSPPYWGLRDYGNAGQIGLEATPDAYVSRLVEVFREVRRVLADDGTLWLNLGDSYTQGGTGRNDTNHRADGRPGAMSSKHIGMGSIPRKVPDGLKPKDLCGIPWRVAFALQADGWYLRSDIIWAKPNPMPESVTDRPTKAHEYLFLLAKSERYYFDAAAIREEGAGRLDLGNMTSGARLNQGAPWSGGEKEEADGRNKRSVWTIATQPFPEAHFATYPEALVLPCVLAGSRAGDTVLDPFAGSGTTGAVAVKQGRSFIGCELNPEYAAMAKRRIGNASPLFSVEVAA